MQLPLIIPRAAPTGIPRINWGAGICDRLRFAFTGGASSGTAAQDFVTGYAVPLRGAPRVPMSHTIRGDAFAFNGVGSTFFLGAFKPILTSSGGGTGDFTVACLASPIGSGTRLWMINGGQSSSLNGWSMVQNDNAADGGQAGNFAFLTTDGGGSSNIDAGITTACDGTAKVYVCRRLGGVLTIWIDGRQMTSSSLTARNVTLGTGFAIGGPVGFTSNGMNGGMMAAYGWDRALADGEIAALWLDPYAPFIFPADDLFAELVGTAAPPPTAKLFRIPNLDGLSAGGPFFANPLG